MSDLRGVVVDPASQREKYLVKKKFSLDNLSDLVTDDVKYSPNTLDDYMHTLDEWRHDGERLTYIYDYVTSTYQRRVNATSVAAFVLSSLTTMLTLSNLGLVEESYPIVNIVLKSTSTAFATAATIATGIPSVLSWSKKRDECEKYLKSVDDLVSSVALEQSLPARFRSDPKQYIVENKKKYANILDQTPDIPHSLYEKALGLYRESKKCTH